jgi:XTP/dITP diphosphohydrolase
MEWSSAPAIAEQELRMVKRLLLATTNAGKIRELSGPLAAAGFELIGLRYLGITAEAPETGRTFLENARQKADFFFALAKLPTLAEDSGLCVNALGGAPGIHSAHYGVEAGIADDAGRNEFLLRALRGVSAPRKARYECALVLLGAGPEPVTATGEVHGEILPAPRGAGGFGYDPLFFHPPLGKSFAEIPRGEKFAVSHRGNAVRALVKKLPS